MCWETKAGLEKESLQRYPITAGGINLPVAPYFLGQEGNLKSIRSHLISIVGKIAPSVTRWDSPREHGDGSAA